MKAIDLCRPSWIVLCLVFSALTIIVVPGTLYFPESDSLSSTDWTGEEFSNCQYWQWSHGWPLEYMRREVPSGELQPNNFWFWVSSKHCDFPVAWSSSLAWPLVNGTTTNQRCSVRSWALILDLLVAGSILIVSVALCERFCRTRSAYRYRLIDLAGFVVVFSLCLAWCVHHMEIRKAEAKLDHFCFSYTAKYQGPDWLKRLVGCPRHFLNMFYHAEHAVVDLSKFSDSNCHELGKLRYLQSIGFTGGALTKDFIDGLRPLPVFESLTLAECFSFVSSEKTFSLSASALPRYPISETASLAELRSLKKLELGAFPVEARSIEHFEKCTKLETLQFTGDFLFIDHLQPLADMACLKELHVDILATEQELEDFNRKHPEFELVWKHSYSPLKVLSKRIYTWGGCLYSDEFIDLSNCKLTSERLKYLKDSLSKVTRLDVGKTENKVVLWQLFDQCENLSVLTIAQEDFDVDTCCKLLRKDSLTDILILNSTFTAQEATQIIEAGNELKESELEIEILGPAIGGKRETILIYDFFR